MNVTRVFQKHEGVTRAKCRAPLNAHLTPIIMARKMVVVVVVVVGG